MTARTTAGLVCLNLCIAAQVFAAEPAVVMRVVQGGEAQYISGGKNPAEREELLARTDDFRLQITFEANAEVSKQNPVAIKLKRLGDNARPMQLTAAGPLLLVNIPSGSYSMTVTSPDASPVESHFKLQPGEIKQLELVL